MIQRIQSIYLAAAVVVSIALFFIPFSTKMIPEATTGTSISHILVINPLNDGNAGTEDASPVSHVNYILLILNLLIMSALSYTIFNFRNRKGQMKLCSLASLLVILQLILVFYYSEQLPGDSKPHYEIGLYLMAGQVFLILMARKSIRKDELLVRSADRIR